MSEPREDGPAPFAMAPHMICNDAHAAIDFYERAFGATNPVRLTDKAGTLLHGSVTINGAAIMLAEAHPEWDTRSPKELKGTPVTIHLCVDNADAWINRAEAAGAKVVMPAADMFWGDRYGVIEDPFGHRWSLSHRLREMTPAEMQAAFDAL